MLISFFLQILARSLKLLEIVERRSESFTLILIQEDALSSCMVVVEVMQTVLKLKKNANKDVEVEVLLLIEHLSKWILHLLMCTQEID